MLTAAYGSPRMGASADAMEATALATAILVVLVYLYALGTFDKPLSSVGLNVRDCARNGFGQTFCGKELTEYRERVDRLKESAEEAETKAKEESEKLEREAREEEAKSEEEARNDEAKAREELGAAGE